MHMSVEEQRYEIAAWCRIVRITNKYYAEFSIEEFLITCMRSIKDLRKKDQDLIVPLLREFKLKMLNI